MLYGNKEWLVTKLNLEKLQDYDVWLSQEADDTGLSICIYHVAVYAKRLYQRYFGNARLNVSLIDYSKK